MKMEMNHVVDSVLDNTLLRFSPSLTISIASGALMLQNIHVAHLSVHTCELWQNG